MTNFIDFDPPADRLADLERRIDQNVEAMRLGDLIGDLIGRGDDYDPTVYTTWADTIAIVGTDRRHQLDNWYNEARRNATTAARKARR